MRSLLLFCGTLPGAEATGVVLLAGYDTDSQSVRRAGRYPPHLIRVNSMSHDKSLKPKDRMHSLTSVLHFLGRISGYAPAGRCYRALPLRPV